jgi:hypothetical protein
LDARQGEDVDDLKTETGKGEGGGSCELGRVCGVALLRRQLDVALEVGGIGYTAGSFELDVVDDEVDILGGELDTGEGDLLDRREDAREPDGRDVCSAGGKVSLCLRREERRENAPFPRSPPSREKRLSPLFPEIADPEVVEVSGTTRRKRSSALLTTR